ncbi:MAG TPA: class I SAM-dependent RNA methyltransferase [Xanthobacteraceae bacterium]|nr:class I SAM-dependent RNA methyltransferase [Xanthobacteraceae bacterium]
MTERLTITWLGHRGDGIADGPDGPIYVPYALPGETVEVEPWAGHPDRRQLLRVTEPSSERITPICPHFSVCGGCALQHWTGERYRPWKRELVVAALAQAGLDCEIGDLIDAHGAGRRRATFHARRSGKDTLSVGFAAAHAHHIVPIDRCPILAPSLAGALPAAWGIAQVLDPMKKPLDIQATATEGGLDVDVRGSGPLSAQTTAKLAQLAEQHGLARLTRHGELVIRRAPTSITMGSATVELPPGAFLQATAEGEAVLAREALAHLAGAKSVIDLFCGVGPFALRIAQFARVAAFDSDEPAIAALTKAAPARGLKPITAARRDLFRRPLVSQELRADAVLFDPPRQGAEAQAREIARSKAPLVVAVSCNPATFARDAKILAEGGYRLTGVTPVDQFRYSFHVEIVAVFRR